MNYTGIGEFILEFLASQKANAILRIYCKLVVQTSRNNQFIIRLLFGLFMFEIISVSHNRAFAWNMQNALDYFDDLVHFVFNGPVSRDRLIKSL